MVESKSILGKRKHNEIAKEDDKQKKLSFPTANKEESVYEIRNNLRFVKPYSHEFKTFAKRRWIDQKLIDVFKVEFKAFSPAYYEGAIEHGKITVNDKIVDIDYRIREGDKIVHKTTRHETPVLATLPKVIYENEEFIVLDKPSSLPVHACGNFMHNTLLKLAESEMDYPNLKTVHRLDRQTSGIVFFAYQ